MYSFFNVENRKYETFTNSEVFTKYPNSSRSKSEYRHDKMFGDGLSVASWVAEVQSCDAVMLWCNDSFQIGMWKCCAFYLWGSKD